MKRKENRQYFYSTSENPLVLAAVVYFYYIPYIILFILFFSFYLVFTFDLFHYKFVTFVLHYVMLEDIIVTDFNLSNAFFRLNISLLI